MASEEKASITSRSWVPGGTDVERQAAVALDDVDRAGRVRR